MTVDASTTWPTSTLISTSRKSALGSVRVVWVSSMIGLATPKGGVVWHKHDNQPTLLENTLDNYMQSKSGMVFLAYQDVKRLGSEGITCVPAYPGILKTYLQKNFPPVFQNVIGVISKGVEAGAHTEIFAGLSPEIGLKHNGRFIIPWGRLGPIPNHIAVEEVHGATEIFAFGDHLDLPVFQLAPGEVLTQEQRRKRPKIDERAYIVSSKTLTTWFPAWAQAVTQASAVKPQGALGVVHLPIANHEKFKFLLDVDSGLDDLDKPDHTHLLIWLARHCQQHNLQELLQTKMDRRRMIISQEVFHSSHCLNEWEYLAVACFLGFSITFRQAAYRLSYCISGAEMPKISADAEELLPTDIIDHTLFCRSAYIAFVASHFYTARDRARAGSSTATPDKVSQGVCVHDLGFCNRSHQRNIDKWLEDVHLPKSLANVFDTLQATLSPCNSFAHYRIGEAGLCHDCKEAAITRRLFRRLEGSAQEPQESLIMYLTMNDSPRVMSVKAHAQIASVADARASRLEAKK
ncbi:hypothetical protein JX266_008888 [Neoarthrinium moseri]|nr:hypothetical protein JX266_008888 [Neoarthrinium moseri]